MATLHYFYLVCHKSANWSNLLINLKHQWKCNNQILCLKLLVSPFLSLGLFLKLCFFTSRRCFNMKVTKNLQHFDQLIKLLLSIRKSPWQGKKRSLMPLECIFQWRLSWWWKFSFNLVTILWKLLRNFFPKQIVIAMWFKVNWYYWPAIKHTLSSHIILVQVDLGGGDSFAAIDTPFWSRV